MSILPDPLKQGDIQFIFAKRLPYLTRLKLVVALILSGLLIQLFINFWFGLIFLGIGVILSLIKGYTYKPTVMDNEEWNQVTPDEYRKVKRKQEQLRKWDTDMFDITNPLGLTILAALAIFCAAVWFFLRAWGEEKLALYWGWDAAVLLAPHWVTGVRTFLKKDILIIKIELLEKIMVQLAAPSDIQVLPMLSTQKTSAGGRVPVDARLMVRFLNAPEYFMGMQVQVSINNVQGKFYPYLYCVLIAREEAALLEKKQDLISQAPKKLVFEKTKSKDVDVLVIRQQTTRNSGYHTNLKASSFIVQTALDQARRLLKG